MAAEDAVLSKMHQVLRLRRAVFEALRVYPDTLAWNPSAVDTAVHRSSGAST